MSVDTAVRERPILFSGPMVRAILDGTKTQTRRVVTDMPAPPAPDCHPRHAAKHHAPYFDAYCGRSKSPENPRGMGDEWCWWQVDDRQCLPTIRCPYGAPGDRLWVRETFVHHGLPEEPDANAVEYRADAINGIDGGPGAGWCPSIYMPRWASRITLQVTNVRVERLQDISEEDAIAEGCHDTDGAPTQDLSGTARGAYALLWEDINAKRAPWDSNPWVWVVEFRRVGGAA